MFSATVSVDQELTVKMDLNLRTAGNLLLKASKEATPVVKALGTGLKAGSDAAITSYHNNRAKESTNRTTGKVHSRNTESEAHHGNFSSGNWQRAQGGSLEAAGGRNQHQHQHQQAAGSRNQHQPGGKKRCVSAPCQGYQLQEV